MSRSNPVRHAVVLALAIFGLAGVALAGGGGTPNQTDTLSPIAAGGAPFRLLIEPYPWKGDPLPALHSAATAKSGDRLLFVGGKTSGLHDFTCDPYENFPEADFNRTLFVVDLATGDVASRSIDDAASGLSIEQRAELASINTLFTTADGRLLAAGGYGLDAAGEFVTFGHLRVVDVAGTIAWVLGDASTLAEHIAFVDPPADAPKNLAEVFFTLTGGDLFAIGEEFWLCLGQSFQGGYTDQCGPPQFQQIYSRQVRRFTLDLDAPSPVASFAGATSRPPWARRRDLNIVPARVPDGDGVVALSGVFTPGPDPGIWTVPIVVDAQGEMSMDDPDDPAALRQGFNVYHAAKLPFWSAASGENWFAILGGLGYRFVFDGGFVDDATFPYSNSAFAVRYAPGSDEWSQHLLGGSYPEILASDGSTLFHGTETETFPLVETDEHGMLDLDALLAAGEPTTLAVLYGGIVAAGQAYPDVGATSASNLMFTVTFLPGPGCSADLDGNGTVDGPDLAALLGQWGEDPAGASSPADLDGDGWVGGVDLSLMLSQWGACLKK